MRTDKKNVGGQSGSCGHLDAAKEKKGFKRESRALGIRWRAPQHDNKISKKYYFTKIIKVNCNIPLYRRLLHTRSVHGIQRGSRVHAFDFAHNGSGRILAISSHTNISRYRAMKLLDIVQNPK